MAWRKLASKLRFGLWADSKNPSWNAQMHLSRGVGEKAAGWPGPTQFLAKEWVTLLILAVRFLTVDENLNWRCNTGL
jgi:hypothetical protein